MTTRSIVRCRAGRLLATALCVAAAAAAPGQAQQGYAIRGNQVLVNQSSHWSAWSGASSLVEISPTRGITPLLMRKGTNAALDATSFANVVQGGVNVGSGSATRLNVIDGDTTTSWGPDPASPLSDWWLELQLGRLVVVEKVIIRFAEESEGDPFLQFKVLGWREPPPRSTTKYLLEGTQIPRYWEIGRTSKPNKTQRVFEFEPRPTEAADDDFTGDPMDRIQIVALSSDSTRAHEVSEDDFAALPAAQQGAIEYYRQERSGRLTRITASEYATIDPARQGPIRYYRRELPRIAEIEVLTKGDNVNLGLVDRGGSAIIEIGGGTTKDITSTIADGRYGAGHNGSAFDEEIYDYLEDLGSLFWVDTMHFLTDGGSDIDNLSVDISDGTRAPDGSIKYTRVGESDSQTGLRFREIRIEPTKVRYLRSTFSNPLDLLSYVGFTEILLYGEGYVPEVVLTSDLVRLPRSQNLISVEWEGTTPDGTAIRLQTRTGDELKELNIYHDSDGNVVTESRYGRLPSSKKGEITTTFEAGDDWSTWSVPYTRSGEEITSPSPRQYLQLRATLVTDRSDTAATLRSVAVNMSNPVAGRLLSEIWPVRVARVGVEELFSLFIRPTFSGSTQRFDDLRIEATAGARMALESVRVGTDAQFAAGTVQEYAAADLAQPADAADTLQVHLPQAVRQGTDLVEVRFRAAILGNSASFRGFVRDSADAAFWQRVDAGDATDLASGQTVTVLALNGSDVIHELRLAQPVVTPNGDGANDELRVEFAVARVAGQRAVSLVIYDLAGRAVARIEEERSDSRGLYSLAWDGRDDDGQLVPPGIYVARVDVDVDSDRASSTSVQRAVYVAY